jgi:hypothetical protein
MAADRTPRLMASKGLMEKVERRIGISWPAIPGCLVKNKLFYTKQSKHCVW